MAARPQNVFRGWLQMACPMQVIGFRKVELRLREEADQVWEWTATGSYCTLSNQTCQGQRWHSHCHLPDSDFVGAQIRRRRVIDSLISQKDSLQSAFWFWDLSQGYYWHKTNLGIHFSASGSWNTWELQTQIPDSQEVGYIHSGCSRRTFLLLPSTQVKPRVFPFAFLYQSGGSLDHCCSENTASSEVLLGRGPTP